MQNFYSKKVNNILNLLSNPMNNQGLDKDEIVNKLVEKITKRGITAYKIAKSTGLTEAGIGKILNGGTKKPNSATLEILNKFINDYDDELIDQIEGRKTENIDFSEQANALHRVFYTMMKPDLIAFEQKINELQKTQEKLLSDFSRIIDNNRIHLLKEIDSKNKGAGKTIRLSDKE